MNAKILMVHIFVNVLLVMNAINSTFAAILTNVKKIMPLKKFSVQKKVRASPFWDLSPQNARFKPVKEEICSDTEGSYECICDNGYEMKGTRCIDINECLYDRCPPIYNCRNSIGSYFCDCTKGFAYDTATKEGFIQWSLETKISF